jgi:chorismate mutase-like protein
MSRDQPSLSDLRREIDDIDDAMHDLLMRRATIAERIKTVKREAGGGVFRPGREAEILRRLAARHTGTVPRDVVVRIWRELISAFIGLQGPFAVAAWDGGEPGCIDLARDHFGSVAPMTRHQSMRGVLQAVAEGAATAGVLPLPQEGEADPWWPALAGGEARVQICARLPFAPGGAGRGDRAGALVVSRGDPEPSGEDRSVLLIECGEAPSRGRLTEALAKADLVPLFVAGGPDSGPPSVAPLYFVELAGFVTAAEPRLASFIREAPGIRAARIVGAYAVPLDAALSGERA